MTHAEPGRAPAGWMSYDSVAEEYQRVAVPRFASLAVDLVSEVVPVAGERLLDVGAGTGLVARCVRSAVGPDEFVAGVDPSLAMLHRALTESGIVVVAAVVPGLPVRASSFDVVTANLVLSHLHHLDDALADIALVLRPRGRFGFTAWAPPEPSGPTNQHVEASDIIDRVRQRHEIDRQPPENAVPWEQQLQDRAWMEQRVAANGLAVTECTLRHYQFTVPIVAFVAGTEWGARSRYLRAIAGEDVWRAVRVDALRDLEDRFGPTLEVTHTAWVVVATR